MHCNEDIYMLPLSPGYSLLLMQEIDNGGNEILNPSVCTGDDMSPAAWRTVRISVLYFSDILLIWKFSRKAHGGTCGGSWGSLWSCNPSSRSFQITLYSPAEHGRDLCRIQSWSRQGRLFVCRLIRSLTNFN